MKIKQIIIALITLTGTSCWSAAKDTTDAANVTPEAADGDLILHDEQQTSNYESVKNAAIFRRLGDHLLSNQKLLEAAQTGDEGGVEKALQDNADINTFDQTGCTALMQASVAGHHNIVTLLLTKKADVNAMTDAGHTALKFAICYGRKSIAIELINSGATTSQLLYGEKRKLAQWEPYR